jgi:hypothetical protein
MPEGENLPFKSDIYYTGGSIESTKPDPTICSATDGWPQHTCTLKMNVASPPAFEEDSGNQAGKELLCRA